MSATTYVAICYRDDGTLKWSTMLGDYDDNPKHELPPTTIYPGETLWPVVVMGRESNGKVFFVPLGKSLTFQELTVTSGGGVRIS